MPDASRHQSGLSSDDDLPGMWTHADFEGGRDYAWEADREARLDKLRADAVRLNTMAAIAALQPEIGPHPDCINTRHQIPHGSHNLMGPGGNKPGARCGGVPAPEIEAMLVMPDRWEGDDG